MPGSVFTVGPVIPRAVIIPAGATGLSPTIELGEYHLGRIDVPANWLAAGLSVQVSADNITFYEMYDATGLLYSLPVGASRGQLVTIADFLSVRWMKLRSGTLAAPVNQTNAPVLMLSLFP